MLYNAVQAKVSPPQEEEEEARCSLVYRLYLRKPVKKHGLLYPTVCLIHVHETSPLRKVVTNEKRKT